MIHKFSMNGYNIVLDVDGGSVHILDDVAYELVDLYEENTKEEIIAKLEDKFTAEQIDEAYDEITSLKEEGLLFTTDTYEFNPNFVNRQKVVKALFKVVIDDTYYEISCVTGYVDYLKDQIKRIEQILEYEEKMDKAHFFLIF